MSTPRQKRADLAARKAEHDRLDVVTEVLSDMVNAALDVTERKGHRECAAEDAKQAHWSTVQTSALAEYFAAADHYFEAKHGSKFVAETRAQRERMFRNDPAMLEAIDHARADLAARQPTGKPAPHDRRRSR